MVEGIHHVMEKKKRYTIPIDVRHQSCQSSKGYIGRFDDTNSELKDERMAQAGHSARGAPSENGGGNARLQQPSSRTMAVEWTLGSR